MDKLRLHDHRRRTHSHRHTQPHRWQCRGQRRHWKCHDRFGNRIVRHAQPRHRRERWIPAGLPSEGWQRHGRSELQPYRQLFLRPDPRRQPHGEQTRLGNNDPLRQQHLHGRHDHLRRHACCHRFREWNRLGPSQWRFLACYYRFPHLERLRERQLRHHHHRPGRLACSHWQHPRRKLIGQCHAKPRCLRRQRHHRHAHCAICPIWQRHSSLEPQPLQ